jgi:hypothetical protein
MSNTNITTTTATTTVVVEENIVRIELNNIGVQGASYAKGDPIYVTVTNKTGATLPKGSIVYTSGANGTHTQVSLALATSDATSARCLGWLSQSIANNADGFCMVEGYLDGVDTQGIAEGSQLYLSGTVAGGFTATKPQAPIHLVYVGVTAKASAGNGRVYVKVQNGYELDELHDVKIDNPVNNQVLTYDSATDLWVNATNPVDGVTSITATAPLTGGTITSTGSIGLDQTALSIIKSQVSDFTSGTVTSASTAQQSGTAVYSVNSGTAVYSTTSGTALTITGSITKSQVSDFTSGTVASATNAGTSVYATNAGTAISISGSIAQSQVTNLVTDLSGKANLTGGNAFTGAQTITSTADNMMPLRVAGTSGQTDDLVQFWRGSNYSGAIERGGAFNVQPSQAVNGYSMFIRTPTSGAIPLLVRGASGQTADLQQWQESNGAVPTFVNSFGGMRVRTFGGSYPFSALAVGAGAASEIAVIVRGASGQTASLQQWQTNTGALVATMSPAGDLALYGNGITSGDHRIGTASYLSATLNVQARSATERGAVIRGAASQTADLLQLQNSAGVNQASVNNIGIAQVYALGVSGNPSGISFAYFTTPLAGVTPVVVRGASGQTADLQQWQGSGGSSNVVINSGGELVTGFAFTRFGGGNSSSGLVNVHPSNNILALAVRGAAGQTSDLQQWQNSAGTVLARVESTGAAMFGNGNTTITNAGSIFTASFRTSNDWFQGSQANSGGRITMTRQTAADSNPGANNARLYFRDGTNAGTLKLCVRAGASGAETTILDNIPQ